MNPASDIRSLYAELGVLLPDWAQCNATVRCFANPDAHAHADRNPSCSVSLEHGAWQCWCCGAHGGAYDAALALGRTPASAMELLIRHGLAEARPVTEMPAAPSAVQPRPALLASPPMRAELAASDRDVTRWHDALFAPSRSAYRDALCRERLWSRHVLRELQLGYADERITIPIRTATGELRGVLRYHPRGRRPKMLAVTGTRLGLIPHPSREPSRCVVLVEGPPDMIAARSRGWPAIAVPGDHAWRQLWARLLAGRQVTVVMDCDAAGRAAADRILADLDGICDARTVDLDPSRTDGFDLTDFLRALRHARRPSCRRSSSSKPTITP